MPEDANMMEAIDVIGNEHRNLWRIAATLDLAADEIAAGAAIDAAFLGAVFDYLEQFVDRMHHPKEDDFLFRRLRERSPEAAAILDRLQAEHRNGPQNLAALRARLAACDDRRAPTADFAEALRTYACDLRQHIRTEEKEVMPLARATLTADDWDAIDRSFLDNADPLFGAGAQAEFRALYHRIASLAPEPIGLGAHTDGELPAAEPGVKGPPLLSVHRLESSYGRIKALKGIDLTIRQKELVALVGANGAGKTTFLRALSGVQPANGQIIFDGEDISRLRPDQRVKRGICQVPEGRQVFGPLSIEDNLRLGAYTQPRERCAADLAQVYALFPVLAEKRALPAGTLSGGQQQMLAIGRALMSRPRLLLLDEPSMGLAPLLVEEVFNVVKTLRSQGMTILLVEQNASAALAIADRAYVLETGSVTLAGTGQELLKNEEVRAAYLGI
jgi:branched-chain amino acid transport system ATP-binding protein